MKESGRESPESIIVCELFCLSRKYEQTYFKKLFNMFDAKTFGRNQAQQGGEGQGARPP